MIKVDKIIKYGWWVLIIIPLVFAFGVYVNNNQLNKKNLNDIDSEQFPAIEKLLNQSYDSLYESRRYFDSEITKFNKASKDLKFLWHPDQEKKGYSDIRKKSGNLEIEEAVINASKYTITITSNWEHSVDNDDLYTHVVITNDGKLVDTKNYSGVAFSHIYKIRVNQTFYYIIGLCSGGTHGCGILLPIINDDGKLIVGNTIENIDFSNYLRIEDFFTRNGELYTVFDDSRYFFDYSASNNASYNSAVPRIFKFNKTNGNIILVTNNFIDLYKKSAQIIFDDLIKLKNNIPEKTRHIIPKVSSSFLAPYLDYYLGMAIIADKTHASEIREKVKKLSFDFFGEQDSPEAHFDGYKDFEKI